MQDISASNGFARVLGEIASQARIPRATYRLQFNPDFTFRDGRNLVPYLDELGISDCYTSPILRATPGSQHGYDVIDHSVINPELGGQEAFDAFAAAVREHGMGLLVDVVPNHMGIGHAENLLWNDVLENGPASIYADFFDVDWHPVKPELENKVLLPILEDQYGAVLESGKLQLTCEEGGFALNYYDFKLPLKPRSYAELLGFRLEALAGQLGESHEHVQELRSILTALSYLPLHSEVAPTRVAERNREKEVIKRRIATLHKASVAVREAVDETLRVFNGAVGDPRSFDRLDALISAQVFRPAYWRVAAEEINYRRFFDINNLAAIRVEAPNVFEYTHEIPFRLLAEGKVTGLRVDHPDGLWHPAAYFAHLQQRYLHQQAEACLNGDKGRASVQESVADWYARQLATGALGHNRWPLYVVAEKILGEQEEMSERWAVYGTTGYDFLNQVGGLFVDARYGAAFERLYSQFIRQEPNYPNLVNSSKKMIMLIALASEMNSLSHRIERLSERNRRYRDFTRNSLTFAMREIVAALPVYRTYLAEDDRSTLERDETYLDAAVAEAKQRNPRTAGTIFDFLRDTMLLRNLEEFEPQDRPDIVEFVMKFQQVTGPVTAKGVEDTAFYIYNRLVSLNEVGGNPQKFGISPAQFHRLNRERRARWPHSLLATSTHDTKRSEDVRARISVLSEMPRGWRHALARWSALNAEKKGVADGQPAPSRNDEYLLYQTLLGAWPAENPSADELADFRERIATYMLKAAKEAKEHTSWVNPNQAYDDAIQQFTRRLIPDDPDDPFRAGFTSLWRQIAFFGQFNALSQLLLKLTAPGVPDIYRGTELWDYSLVDPDNRRPVDYSRHRAALRDVKTRLAKAGENLLPLARELLADGPDGRVKLYVLYRTLHLRHEQQRLFAEGDYRPLRAVGAEHDHVVAFRRALGDESLVVAVPRLVRGLAGGQLHPPLGKVWGDADLVLPGTAPGSRLRHLFTGEIFTVKEQNGRGTVGLAKVFSAFPVALLTRVE